MKLVKMLLMAIVMMAIVLGNAQTTKPAYPVNQPIPSDQKVITGQLENGLKYYIKANKKPEKRAVFFLAVDAGSVLERDDQMGLAHFVEHMGFNGTKQFPGNTLVSELEKKGVIFGRDINASTGLESTQYYVVLPTDDSVLFDMGLKILDGWAFNMLLSEKEIDKERGVIIEEWRVYRSADERLMAKTLPIELKGSPYASRLPIGTLENLQSFTYKSLRDFYKSFYRTDNMSIIIVGDFDPVEMEQKVKDFFTMTPAAATPLNRTVYEIPGNKEPLIAIATDAEATSTDISVNFKKPAMNFKTYADYRKMMSINLFCFMLRQRYDEISEQKTSPFTYGGAWYSDYWSKKNDAFSLSFSAKEGKAMPTLEVMLTELKRLEQFGFVATEFERAKSSFLASVEKSAKEADKKDSRNHAYTIANSFYGDRPILSDSLNLLLTKYFIDGITIEEINSLIKDMISEENITVVLTMPEKKEIKVPTDVEIKKMFEKVKKMKTSPYIDKVNSSPFLVKEPTSGKVISKKVNNELGFTELVLSNGAKVIIKPTTYQNDEIQLVAFSKGGNSIYPDNKLINAYYATDVISSSGIGNYTSVDYTKFMMGKKYSIYPYISTYDEGFNGNTTVKDFEFFLQHLYMYFEAPRADQDVLDRMMTEWKDQISMQKNSRDYQFSKFTQQQMYPNNTRMIFLDEKNITKINLGEMKKIFKERFTNAGEFTFILVGNIDVDKVIPMIEKYIGGIPGKTAKEEIINRVPEFAKGVVDKTFKMGVSEKTTVSIATNQVYQWSEKSILAISALNSIMQIKMTENIREKLGGTYGARLGLYPTKWPVQRIMMSISLGCEPARIEELTNAIWATIDEIMLNGPTEIDLKKVKEQMIRSYEVSLENNRTWTSSIKSMYYLDNQFYTLAQYKEIVNALTIEDIKTVAQYMKHNEYVRTILLPESAN
ncbi:MAG: peptidase domain protein [Bacteroidetes bacterium]|nr:peptidase domain protein [Bacteroidota bacterium]